MTFFRIVFIVITVYNITFSSLTVYQIFLFCLPCSALLKFESKVCCVFAMIFLETSDFFLILCNWQSKKEGGVALITQNSVVVSLFCSLQPCFINTFWYSHMSINYSIKTQCVSVSVRAEFLSQSARLSVSARVGHSI